MKKTIVLGRGFLGKEFERHGYEVWSRDKFEALKTPLSILDDYDIIINCIAKSNTRWCEDKINFLEALNINGHHPAELSMYCEKNNKKFVHISTGCLYDETHKSNNESSFIAAHCNYTVTKWIGEMGCNSSRDLILRPRLLFSDVKDKNNLLCKLPNYDKYVSDKKDSLTSTTTIVHATTKLLENNCSGIFNIAEDGYASIYEIVCWCDKFNKPIPSPWWNMLTSINTVRENEKLYLVNNIMSINKLKQYYQPPKLIDRINECYKKLSLQK